MRNLVFVFSFGFSLTSFAQNLVVNPYFIPSKEPRTEAQLYLAHGYSNPNRGTTDLFSRAASSHSVGIPFNFTGTQEINGAEHYAGIISYYSDLAGQESGYGKYSEYLQVELREPLTAGASYQIGFDASLAESSGFASTLGIYLSANQLSENNNSVLNLKPQFESHQPLVEVKNWITVDTIYIASGGERYLTIGRFSNKIDTVEKNQYANNRKAYYYLSNVIVAKVEPAVDTAIIKLVETIKTKAKNNKTKVTKVATEPTPEASHPTIYFAIDSYALDTTAYRKLEELCLAIANNPKLKVIIEGHTDLSGDSSYNLALAAKRAESTKNFFLAKGIATNRLSIKSVGSKQLAVTTGAASNLKNRRVVIRLAE